MENKNIVLIVGIFILGLVIGGFFGGGLTGRVSNINSLTAAKTNVFISPANPSNGEILSVTIDSRSGGSSPIVYLRDGAGVRKDRIQWCRGLDDFGNQVVRTGSDEDSSCYSRVTFEYKLLEGYRPGTYYFEVMDDASQEYARSYFEVIG